MRRDTLIKLPKSPLWRTFHQDKSPYLRALMDTFFEFLQDEIDKFGYSLYRTGIYGSQKVYVEYGYDEEDDKPVKPLTDADIEVYWQEFLDAHIAEWGGGIYEEACQAAIADHQAKIVQCRKSARQHKQMMELYNAANT